MRGEFTIEPDRLVKFPEMSGWDVWLRPSAVESVERCADMEHCGRCVVVATSSRVFHLEAPVGSPDDLAERLNRALTERHA